MEIEEESSKAEADGMDLRGILRWYFSPYITTLVTAPMFLVIAGLAVWFSVHALILEFQVFLRYPVLLCIAGPVGLGILFAAASLLYQALLGIPLLWRKPWSAVARMAAILGVFVGCIFGAFAADYLVTFAVAWLTR